MKKTLDLSNFSEGADNLTFTIKLSIYEDTGNARLDLEANGEPIIELTLNPDVNVLPFFAVFNSKEYQPLIEGLISLGIIHRMNENIYIDGVQYPIYTFKKKVLNEYTPEDYKEYCEITNNGKGNPNITYYNLFDYRKKERHDHWEATKGKKWHPDKREPKGVYKTSENQRARFLRYRENNETLHANLPKGTKALVEARGEKCTVVLKRELLRFLDELERKDG